MPNRSPLSVTIDCKSDGAIPCFLANPIAAGVHSPSAFRAALIGGPSTACSVSFARSSTSVIRTESRRGVAKTRDLPIAKPLLVRPVTKASARASAIAQYSPAGSSSTPSSNNTVRELMRNPPQQVSLTQRQQDLHRRGEIQVWRGTQHSFERRRGPVSALAKYTAAARSPRSRGVRRVN